ncbi:MAG: GNAT family N-acetyltransferase [Cetobacterium sp.]
MIDIRKACIEDYTSLCSVYDELDSLHLQNHPELFKKPLISSRDESDIKNIIEDPNRELFVAEYNSEIIGFTECFIATSIVHPVIKERKWIQLDNIAVKSKYQNKKVGNLLLKKVKEWAKEKNINRIELTVYSFNANTISFYGKNGFNEISKKMYLDF